jgi:two-component system C4-dicarboxylate transport sensor histidine kinase DctB
MRPILRARVAMICVFALLVALCAGGVWRYGYVQALGQVHSRGEVDLRLASDRLTRNLQRFQELVVLLSDHPSLIAVLDGGDRVAAQELLVAAADKTSARNLIYVDDAGRVLVSALPQVPQGLSESPYFERAMHGALGSYHDVTGAERLRRYIFAAPSFGQNRRVRGALIVEIDVDAIEFEWRGDRPAVFFTDDQRDVFVSNRTEMLLWSVDDAGVFRSREGAVQDKRVTWMRGFEIWRIDWGPYLPERALHVTLPLPVIGLTGEALIDVSPAMRLAGLQAAAFAAISLAAGALLFLFAERRRVLAVQNARLEARVAERTFELRRAQEDLVQAGKLSALGQMSAGISQEFNQPLMAIRSFSENATQFMERGQPEIAAQNLARISDLARRMGRIIQNLRSFARNESEPIGVVDMAAIIEGALELSAERLKRDAVDLEWRGVAGPAWVRGGEVRLGQVMLNLIANACDAMDGQPVKRLRLAIVQGGARTAVHVEDTGPGIEAPDKLFEPFYTTKEVGASEGMGLGLSISYGLVQSFGGAIRGENVPGGGALFVLDLDSAIGEDAGPVSADAAALQDISEEQETAV